MWNDEKLINVLTCPSDRLVEDMSHIEGDIMILGAGGKMGPNLCMLAANAVKKGNLNKKIYAVSRFSDPVARENMEKNGVTTISADLEKPEDLKKLPDVKNIIFMAGRKFGTDGAEAMTWGMNAVVPVLVNERFKGATFVVFSSGNIYDLVAPSSGGSLETDKVKPIGEYTQSCLARERVFEYYSRKYGSKVLVFRLSYSIALEYGVISDIAKKVNEEIPIELGNACFNCIWQGDANEYAIRSLLYAESPSRILNVTGPEIIGVKSTALKLGQLLGKKVTFVGEPGDNAYLENSSEAMSLFGYPQVSVDTMIKYQAQWIKDGGRNIGKPTHFEEKKGSY